MTVLDVDAELGSMKWVRKAVGWNEAIVAVRHFIMNNRNISLASLHSNLSELHWLGSGTDWDKAIRCVRKYLKEHE